MKFTRWTIITITTIIGAILFATGYIQTNLSIFYPAITIGDHVFPNGIASLGAANLLLGCFFLSPVLISALFWFIKWMEAN